MAVMARRQAIFAEVERRPQLWGRRAIAARPEWRRDDAPQRESHARAAHIHGGCFMA